LKTSNSTFNGSIPTCASNIGEGDMMQLAIMVQTSRDVEDLNTKLERGWAVETICPLVPSTSVGTMSTSKTELGRALVILEQ